MSGDSTETAHPKFRISLRPDGIVYLTWAPGVAIGVEDAVAATEAIAGLGGGQRVLALICLGEGSTQDRPARLEFSRRDDLVTAAALVVRTPALRVMGNLFVNVNRPKTPIRVFDDEASAIAWLQEFTP
ncbi:DUF7793 family protein [Demequina lutea]|uniref:DUF7793 domain-containing protein n=1 Tax=Demequina lutea TaxID=431489 RepID=A0A7Y9ZA83_9MICO|nr:hypothetical protein [Demequina lutea]NYI41466.1 hypothetical protein [Demequina lutea]